MDKQTGKVQTKRQTEIHYNEYKEGGRQKKKAYISVPPVFFFYFYKIDFGVRITSMRMASSYTNPSPQPNKLWAGIHAHAESGKTTFSFPHPFSSMHPFSSHNSRCRAGKTLHTVGPRHCSLPSRRAKPELAGATIPPLKVMVSLPKPSEKIGQILMVLDGKWQDMSKTKMVWSFFFFLPWNINQRMTNVGQISVLLDDKWQCMSNTKMLWILLPLMWNIKQRMANIVITWL